MVCKQMTLRVGRKALLISQLYFLLRTARDKKAAFIVNWARPNSIPEVLLKKTHKATITHSKGWDFKDPQDFIFAGI